MRSKHTDALGKELHAHCSALGRRVVERSCIRDAGYGSPAKESDTKQSRDD